MTTLTQALRTTRPAAVSVEDDEPESFADVADDDGPEDALPDAVQHEPRPLPTALPPAASAQWCARIYYDLARKEFLIQNEREDWFSVTDTALRRQAKVRGMSMKASEGERCSEFEQFAVHVQNNRGVAYAGPLAGHAKGPCSVNGSLILVTQEPAMIPPIAGEWPVLRQLLEGMFRDAEHDQLTYIYGWLKTALECLRSHVRKPGQVLVIAGPVESGKSLIQTIITWLLGGRECKPHGYMTGATDFNADLFAAEHLRLDDEQSSCDIRARRALGARIKELLFGHAQRLHAKRRDALTLDPIWRMTISLNEEPESLQVLPVIDESLEDKITILCAAKRPMPMPTGSTEQVAAFERTLRAELPAFVHWLLHHFEIPDHLRNERCGIAHWHHPKLMVSIRELSPEARLLALVDREIFANQRHRDKWEGTADELDHQLTGNGSTVACEARKLLSWNNATGTYLGRLLKSSKGRVEPARTSTARRWVIHPPEENF